MPVDGVQEPRILQCNFAVRRRGDTFLARELCGSHIAVMAAIAKFPQESGSRLWMQSRREGGANISAARGQILIWNRNARARHAEKPIKSGSK
jgi:hypothetical protein